ncbi:MAG: tRNA uridine-5-carboxymethylaminomethyl(34) synthesis GTPase MnmE [Bacteroidales bacterium]|nr:tRNA uridine-5-carboxymethylaminomethyl(34) synthesis GTPase MnmE [Bacteroidales bacterium]
MDKDTICAISSSPGNGAIAIIRLSGDDAVNICDGIFYSKSGIKIIDQKTNTIQLGKIKSNNKIIDEVLISLFKLPNSYTGEDIVEISCHGSSYIQQKILQLLIHNGARIAKPGEFTLRAFMNRKMDLSQAEAVADLIASTSKASHSLAINQMRGGFSSEINKLRNQLLQFVSLIELELDFSEEDVEFADRKKLSVLISDIKKLVEHLIKSFELGNVIKNGIPITIIGEPNVGKSTLLNILLNENKAIVSEIPGTTRDIIEDVINIDGYNFRFIDTAGIRQTTDEIETLGIKKTFEKIGQASIVLFLVDAIDSSNIINQKISELKKSLISNKTIIVIVNKTDLIKDKEINKFSKEHFPSLDKNDALIYISAKNKTNIKLLTDKLIDLLNLPSLNEEHVVVTNLRHYEALLKVAQGIERILNGLKNQISNDFLAQDVREVLHYLGEITGEVTNDEILGNIFSNFCIGK